MIAKLRAYPHSFWSPMKVKIFLITGTPKVVISIIALSISLYCKCFQNRKSCVCKHTRVTSLLVNDPYTELQQILDPLPNISDQLLPQIFQEILKASGVGFSKFECYKHHKAKCHTCPRLLKLH